MGLFQALIMNHLTLSPSVLQWAASEVGMSLREVAGQLSKQRQDEIVKGNLTESQLTKFAKLCGVPLGYLFLPEPPPERRLPIADFRTVQFAEPLTRDFFDTLEDIQFKQDWYREYLEREGAAPLAFVGGCSVQMAPKTIADSIRAWLELVTLDRTQLRNADELYGELVRRAERVGVLVFKNGVVGNNGKRPLSVREFRGFALCDQFAPVVFINGSDAPAAWLFTLAHELAHIWLGHSGVSDASTRTDNVAERLCNQVAAEVLVPESEFRPFWENCVKSGVDVGVTVSQGRLTFKVSELVIARRAMDYGFISHDLYEKFAVVNAKKASAGGDFYATLRVRNSRTFTAKVASLAANGSISFREASKLLRIAPNRVMTVHNQNRAIST